ncbi:hypothetical protein VP01_3164g4 [Puccinia sorghi]|uniref:U1-type domain-containing protein n=1 Tax=Puccinia sorghi TaxID=27349 RepID=A0A0L6V0M8_9BASI|nr:hypothetical protein VP01_3164g4 [Puccinia sorghi]
MEDEQVKYICNICEVLSCEMKYLKQHLQTKKHQDALEQINFFNSFLELSMLELSYCRLPYSWQIAKYHASRSMYLQVRSSFSMCDFVLPHWEPIRIMMARFHKLLKLTIIKIFSVLNNKCFCLSIKDILQHVSQFLFF